MNNMKKVPHVKVKDVVDEKKTMPSVAVAKATEVRQNFQEIIDKVHYTGEGMVISKHGKPWVLIQPLSEKDDRAKDLVSN